MSNLANQLDAIIATCLENQTALVESLNLCFDAQFSLEIGTPGIWPPADLPEELAEPGLIVNLHVGDAGIAIAIPSSLPLPIWVAHPNDSQQARINTLPMEWALLTVPAELEVDHFACQSCELLEAALTQCQPEAGAKFVPWTLRDAEGDESRIWVILPVNQVFVPQQPKVESPRPAAPPVQAPAAEAKGVMDPRMLSRQKQLRHLLKLPVPVIVKLAEKRIELGQLLALGPGAIVTFEKSCEDLLELCVNNEVYCRGEAVKIGEKFGLKINEVGSLSERERALQRSRIIV